MAWRCGVQARGNVLKVDRHKYVKLAYHGFQEMTANDRKATYNTNYQVCGLGR